MPPMAELSGPESSGRIPDQAVSRPEQAGGANTGTTDVELAEPRSRAEVADEARTQTVPPEYLPSRDGHRTPAGASHQEHSGGHDGPDWRRVTVVQADRTLGDTTPVGIGLKPTGEEILDMESDQLARGARFRRNAYERAEDIQDVTEKTADTLQGLLGAHRPMGHDVSATVHPSIDAPAPSPADAGNIVMAGLVLGLLADRAIHWGRQRLERSKG